MLLDANIMIYAWDEDSPHHAAAASFVARAIQGSTRLGLPLQTIAAFIRLTTDARIARHPLTPTEAVSVVHAWLGQPGVWVPETTARSASIFLDLVETESAHGRLVPDAQLAAMAIEHGVPVVSADTDFARFRTVTWINPLD